MYEMNTDSILIVDDDPMYLRLARFLLDAEGFEVDTAANAEDAQAKAAARPPQLILMDIQLPGIDGLELTRRLKADPATRDIIVLALSGSSVDGYEERARHAGCDGCITKPIDTSTFANIVKQHLGARQDVKPIVHTSDYHDLLTQLRNEFLVEGAAETERVLRSLNNKFDLQRVLRLAHRWTGIGGTLGMPEISHKARQIKQSLENPDTGFMSGQDSALFPGEECLSRMRADMLAVQQIFSNAIKRQRDTPVVSAGVSRVLSHMVIGIVGFERPEAERIANAFVGSGATSKILEQTPDAERFQTFDAVIVNAQQPSLPRGMSVESLISEGKPVLFIAARGAQVLGDPDVLEQLGDFLLAPWDAQEVVMRVCRVISRKSNGIAARKSAGKREVKRALRVVVADDEKDITTLVESALKKCGVDCRYVHDGGAALDLARTFQPDVMVLDVMMPDLDGFGVLMSLKRDERTSHVKVILLTACNQESDIMRGFGLGADDYVTKPFNPLELAARVTRFTPRLPAMSVTAT